MQDNNNTLHLWSDISSSISGRSVQDKKNFISNEILRSKWKNILAEWEIQDIIDFLILLDNLNQGIIEEIDLEKSEQFLISKVRYIEIIMEII